MKEKVIKEIEQRMASILNNEQKEKLKEVLLYTFFNIEITNIKDELTEDTTDYAQLFISAKRIEGCSERTLNYYETTITVGDSPLLFYFEITNGEEVCTYTRLGFSDNMERQCMFAITPGFHVPQWAKGAVMYQIFVDRFCNGDPSNDVLSDEYVYIGFPVTKVENWEEGLSVLDVDRFYGGDLQGILD